MKIGYYSFFERLVPAARKLSVGVILLSASYFFIPSVEAEKFAVVVHPYNEYEATSEDMARIVKALFLKETRNWPIKGLEAAKPFGANPDSEIYKAFLEKVLLMSDAEYSDHWLSKKQEDGSTSPRSCANSRMLTMMLSKYRSGFGVLPVSEVEKYPGLVRVLFEF